MTKTPKKKNTARNKKAPLHWLVRPGTIRKLWIGGVLLLAALVLIEPLANPHGYFGIDDSFGFNAWYGFFVCVVMIIAAKGLGVFLKREDTYYERD